MNNRGEAARVRYASDGSVIVALFDDTYGGTYDLWLLRIDAQGDESGPFFWGCIKHGSIRLPEEGWPRIGFDFTEEEGLRVVPPEEDDRELSINLEELARDSDRDGLTDRVEVRLGTDPRDEDTDGDGLEDSRDNNPILAGSGGTISVGDWMLREAFKGTVEACKESVWGDSYSDTFMVVETPSSGPFALRNPQGITLFKSEEELMRLYKQIGDGFCVVRFRVPWGDSISEEYPVKRSPFCFSRDLRKAAVEVHLWNTGLHAIGFTVYFERSDVVWRLVNVAWSWIS